MNDSKFINILSDNQTQKKMKSHMVGSGDYVKGIFGLAKGLRKVTNAYPLVIIVLPNVPEDHRLQLLRQGCFVFQIQPIDPLGKELFLCSYV